MTYGHLRTDCLYTGISYGPTLGVEYGKPLSLPFISFDKTDMVSRRQERCAKNVVKPQSGTQDDYHLQYNIKHCDTGAGELRSREQFSCQKFSCGCRKDEARPPVNVIAVRSQQYLITDG